MASLAAGFLTLWVAVLGWFWHQYRHLQIEVSYLPRLQRTVKGTMSPLLGHNLRAEVPFPEQFAGLPVAVLVTSARCSACHGEIEQFLQLYRKYPLPFVCLLVAGEGDTERFWKKNGGLFPIVEVERERLTDLGILVTPSYLLTDPEGRVEHEVLGATYVYKHMRRYFERR